MAARCGACASERSEDGGCGTCGETLEAGRYVTYLGISVMGKCPKCGNPLQIPGPHRELLCDHCLETSTAKDDFWDIIDDAMEYGSQSPGEPSGWRQNFQTDIDCMITAPKCPGCKALLPAASVPTGSDGDVFCPFCGDDINTYPAPDWLKAVCPRVAQVFGAEKTGHADAGSAEVKPITFLCPDCGANLKITVEEARVITCQYCDSDCYLPDGLWRRLHPVRTRAWWYVRLHDTAGQRKADAEASVKQRRRDEEVARYEAIVEENAWLRGTDAKAHELKTWFAVTSVQERDSATLSISDAMHSEWAVEPTAKAILRLRAMLNDDKRERLLLGKLEVLIAERRGDVALELLRSIKLR